MKNNCLFTIDVEEWWSVHSFRKFIDSEENSAVIFDDRINTGLDIILDLLDKYRIKGLFFILGRVAEKYPDVVRQIVDEGHDIGTHGFDHQLVYEQTPEEFEVDLVKSINAIEKAIDRKVDKYRAPSYSITASSLWAFKILAAHGIRYDFSLFPCKNKRFGIAQAKQQPYIIKMQDGETDIIEIPPNILDLSFFKTPINSGFGFRLFPFFLISFNVKRLIKKSVIPNFIIHNWEVDIQHPRIKSDLKGQIIHYYNLKNTTNKLKKLFSLFNFSSVESIYLPYFEVSYSELNNLQ